MEDHRAETDPERLRAEVLRLAENHDQVVGWLRDKEAENVALREQLAGAVSDRDALAEAARGVVFAFLAGGLKRADVQPLVHELDRLGGR